MFLDNGQLKDRFLTIEEITRHLMSHTIAALVWTTTNHSSPQGELHLLAFTGKRVPVATHSTQGLNGSHSYEYSPILCR